MPDDMFGVLTGVDDSGRQTAVTWHRHQHRPAWAGRLPAEAARPGLQADILRA